jgi:hypothetical protein
MGEAYSTPGGDNASKILVGKPEGKRPLRRPMHRCEDNIKIDQKEIWWVWPKDTDQWLGTVNMEMNLQDLTS